jgi:integrase
MMTRRGKGEGTIRKRADGLWEARIDLGVVDGKRRQKSIYGKTRREVQQKLADLKRQAAQGVNLAVPKQTVAQFLDHWLAYTVQPNLAAKTYQSYEGMVRIHLTPIIGHLVLTDLAPQHIDGLIQQLRTHDLAKRTVQYAVAVLSRALNRAVKYGVIARNPVDAIDMPGIDKRPPTILDEAQAAQFLATLAGHRLEALYRVALSLGLRKGELIALAWRDVNLEKGTLTVQRSKTKAGMRTLTLPDMLVEVLRDHWAFQQQERLVQGTAWKEHGLVFPSDVGTPLLEGNLHRHFKQTLKKAGLPDIRFHDMRHSCASFLAAQEVHPAVAQKILGHTRISTTLEIYTHVRDESQRQALEKISQFPGVEGKQRVEGVGGEG